MRHKGARTHDRGEKKTTRRGRKPRKKDTMQIAMETAAGLAR